MCAGAALPCLLHHGKEECPASHKILTMTYFIGTEMSSHVPGPNLEVRPQKGELGEHRKRPGRQGRRSSENSRWVQRTRDAANHSLKGGCENDLDCPVSPRIEGGGRPAGQTSCQGLEGIGNSLAPHHTVTIQGCLPSCSTLSPCYTHQKMDFLSPAPSRSG